MNRHQARPEALDRDRLVAEHGRLVDREVARYRTWHIDRADLRQAGVLGLLIAASRFDPERAVPFAAYAHTWVRKEIQRAISQQEFPAVLPADLVGRTVALRRALDEHADRLHLAAAALGISPATVAALHRQLDAAVIVDDEELPAPGYTLTDPAHTAAARDFATAVRAALARMEPRRARRPGPALRPGRPRGAVVPPDRPPARRLRPHRPRPRGTRPGRTPAPHHLTMSLTKTSPSTAVKWAGSSGA